jgi:hypothetical protein
VIWLDALHLDRVEAFNGKQMNSVTRMVSCSKWRAHSYGEQALFKKKSGALRCHIPLSSTTNSLCFTKT